MWCNSGQHIRFQDLCQCYVVQRSPHPWKSVWNYRNVGLACRLTRSVCMLSHWSIPSTHDCGVHPCILIKLQWIKRWVLMIGCLTCKWLGVIVMQEPSVVFREGNVTAMAYHPSTRSTVRPSSRGEDWGVKCVGSWSVSVIRAAFTMFGIEATSIVIGRKQLRARLVFYSNTRYPFHRWRQAMSGCVCAYVEEP